MRERWRKVRRADGYKVSSLGRVKSCARTLTGGQQLGETILKPYEDASGYLRVTIRGEHVLVHHLVLEAFDRPRPYGLEGCHGRNGKRDNRASELRWDTHESNVSEERTFGRIQSGRTGSVRGNGKEGKEEFEIEELLQSPLRPVTPVSGDMQG